VQLPAEEEEEEEEESETALMFVRNVRSFVIFAETKRANSHILGDRSSCLCRR
jgi:hypothetical protein